MKKGQILRAAFVESSIVSGERVAIACKLPPEGSQKEAAALVAAAICREVAMSNDLACPRQGEPEMVLGVRVNIVDSRAVIVGPADPITIRRCHELVQVEVHQGVLQVLAACRPVERT